jgi:hypothetical protein
MVGYGTGINAFDIDDGGRHMVRRGGLEYHNMGQMEVKDSFCIKSDQIVALTRRFSASRISGHHWLDWGRKSCNPFGSSLTFVR